MSAHREDNKNSLISGLCYKSKRANIAEFLMDPDFNYSMQAISVELKQHFEASSTYSKTLDAAVILTDLCTKYAKHFEKPHFWQIPTTTTTTL